MTDARDTITADRHPDFARSERVTRPQAANPVGDALAGINDALQAPKPDDRAERIWEAWGEHCDFRNISVEDAIWFIAHAPDGWDWGEALMSVSYGKFGWPRASWDRDGEEPADTVEVLADLESIWEAAMTAADADLTPETARAERDAFIAYQGLDQRFKRTHDDDMGW